MEALDGNIISLLKRGTQQKLITVASKMQLSPDVLSNVLLNDEIERQRLLEACNDPLPIRIQEQVPIQKIITLCNKHLSKLNHESEIIEFMAAVESLYRELLQLKLLSVNSRQDHIIETLRGTKTTRIDYYWYAGSLARNIANWFGTIEVYLGNAILPTREEIIFIGMPNNIEVCNKIYLRFYKILKKIKLIYKKNAGKWGNKREIEEEAGRYMSAFAEKLQYTRAYIENKNYDKHLYDYVEKKYYWALR